MNMTEIISTVKEQYSISTVEFHVQFPFSFHILRKQPSEMKFVREPLLAAF